MNSIVWKVEAERESQRWNRFGKMACGARKAKSRGLCTVVSKTHAFKTVYGKNTIVYEHKRSPYTVSVFHRISSYTVTGIYDRNTITCFMAKYGRIRNVFGMYTVVYDAVYDRKRPFTESVTVDLGL